MLGLALPFSIVPLGDVHRRPAQDGRLAAPVWVTVLAALTALLLIVLNFKLLGRSDYSAKAAHFSTRLQPDGIRRSCGRKRPL